MGMTVRYLERSTPKVLLRLWIGGRGPDERELADSELVVEWAGRSGHPTSYALIGGVRRGEQSSLAVPAGGPPYAASLVGRADTVTFGLPDSYRSVVIEMIDSAERPIEVTIAAHGMAGSSAMAFRRLTAFLVNTLDIDVDTAAEDEIWGEWDRAQ